MKNPIITILIALNIFVSCKKEPKQTLLEITITERYTGNIEEGATVKLYKKNSSNIIDTTIKETDSKGKAVFVIPDISCEYYYATYKGNKTNRKAITFPGTIIANITNYVESYIFDCGTIRMINNTNIPYTYSLQYDSGVSSISSLSTKFGFRHDYISDDFILANSFKNICYYSGNYSAFCVLSDSSEKIIDTIRKQITIPINYDTVLFEIP